MTVNAEQVFLVVLTSLITVIAFFLKDLKKQNDDKHRDIDKEIATTKEYTTKEIEKIRDNLTSIIAALPHTYVLRDDFLRAISGLDMKMDTIARDVGELNKNVSKLLAGGTEREH